MVTINHDPRCLAITSGGDCSCGFAQHGEPFYEAAEHAHKYKTIASGVRCPIQATFCTQQDCLETSVCHSPEVGKGHAALLGDHAPPMQCVDTGTISMVTAPPSLTPEVSRDTTRRFCPENSHGCARDDCGTGCKALPDHAPGKMRLGITCGKLDLPCYAPECREGGCIVARNEERVLCEAVKGPCPQKKPCERPCTFLGKVTTASVFPAGEPCRPSRCDEFDAATDVTTKRGAVYGHPADNFKRIAALQALVAECPIPEVRHALDMICVKLARVVETPDHLDSYIDIAGYARTALMVLDRLKPRT